MMDSRAAPWFFRAHGPTWVAAATIYGSWLVLTLAHDRIPIPLLMVLGGSVVAWHGSLQHETIHGHPAGPRWLGRALGAPPLSLYLPYEIYREMHRLHHATNRLTEPSHDPEAPFDWTARSQGRFARTLQTTQQTVLGRLAFGPPLTIGAFLSSELIAVVRGTPGHRRAWALHVFASALVLAWLIAVAHLPLWKYVLAFVYPGVSLTLLRSFAEHRRDASRERRTTVIEAGCFFRLVFMNNNFHIAHHARPRAPWFELPRIWREQRATVAERTPDLIYDGYLGIVRRRFARSER